MWMSNVFVVINQNNTDRNSLCDLCQAIGETGAAIIAVDDQKHVIEANVPAHEVPTIVAMEGVTCVRSFFNYIKGTTPRQSA